MGDIVSVITAKTGKPSYDWINMVKARPSVKPKSSWFKKEYRPENITHGQNFL